MYNLSDKELDRLSREAASQHDPGDLVGPDGWQRLEMHLDKELGTAPAPSARPDPVPGIRRLPFQYVPVIAVILGVSYFAVRQFNKDKKGEASEGPPLSVSPSTPSTQHSSSNNQDHKENSTPLTTDNAGTAYADSGKTVPYSAGLPGSAKSPANAASESSSPANKPLASSSSASTTTNPVSAAGTDPISASTAGPAAPGASTAGSTAGSSTAGSTGTSTASRSTAGATGISKAGSSTAGSTPVGSTAGSTGSSKQGTSTVSSLPARPTRGNGNSSGSASAASLIAHRTHSAETPQTGTHKGRRSHKPLVQYAAPDPFDETASNTASNKAPNTSSTTAARAKRNAATAYPSLAPSTRPALKRPAANDSAMLAYARQTAIPKKPGRALHINRSLRIGLQLAPDFTSVNALAGDKPGSSIGITADYQLFNRFYIGSGLLYSKKNYAARVQDCHMPNDYFRANNLHNVDFIKGTLNMLEIPLNLRYDFSVSGNTLFFASAGTSSYISLNQRNDYYYDFFGREAFRRFNYDQKKTYLFSSVNLSLGVETGLNNSLSLMIAPYIKVPAGSIGFGEFKMNSVGINFALKFAPVLSRTRR